MGTGFSPSQGSQTDGQQNDVSKSNNDSGNDAGAGGGSLNQRVHEAVEVRGAATADWNTDGGAMMTVTGTGTGAGTGAQGGSNTASAYPQSTAMQQGTGDGTNAAEKNPKNWGF
jgi:hypothetical protein